LSFAFWGGYQIVLENSSAESGVIIIKENTSFLIMGTGSQVEGKKKAAIVHTRELTSV
jgi:hypothetical protein